MDPLILIIYENSIKLFGYSGIITKITVWKPETWSEREKIIIE